ncbi:MAG: hypothetical protein JO372_19725 [Solirubrobacterales bacterium]|nr:hypothetical protein [Solirubrobacterales bacterium]
MVATAAGAAAVPASAGVEPSALVLASGVVEPSALVLASGMVEPSTLAGGTAASVLATEAAPPVAEVTDAESARASIASWLVSSTAVSTATHQALSLIRHPSSAHPRSFAVPTETPQS